MNISLAGCVIENDKKEILLLHRNTPKRTQWETPGGKIEESENPAAAAVREVKEELGVEVKIVRKLGGEVFTEDGFEMSYVWFLAEIVTGTPIPVEDKLDKVEYFSWEELKEKADLSANTKNLVNAYFEKKIIL